MYSNWWSNPPYTNKNISGIFPTLLKILTKTCCGKCQEHTKSEINFDYFSKQSHALKLDENVVRGDIEDNSEISFPITGRYGQSSYNDHAFVPLVESGGTVFMTIVDEQGMMASMVVMQVFKLWPMCMAVFVSAFFAGIVMWILVSVKKWVEEQMNKRKDGTFPARTNCFRFCYFVDKASYL